MVSKGARSAVFLLRYGMACVLSCCNWFYCLFTFSCSGRVKPKFRTPKSTPKIRQRAWVVKTENENVAVTWDVANHVANTIDTVKANTKMQ